MIGQIVATGSGFRGLVSYLMRGKKGRSEPDRVDWSETLNLAVDDPDLAVPIMRATARRSKRCAKPVHHMVLSWREDENPAPEAMRAVAHGVLFDLDLTEHQAVLVAHKDKSHRHLHMVVNRIDPETGVAWNRWRDEIRLEVSAYRHALDHGFLPVPGRHNSPEQFTDKAKRATPGEYQAAKRKGLPEPTPHLNKEQIGVIKGRLVETISKAKSWTELARALEADQMSIERKGQGLVIVTTDGYLKLSELAKGIRLASLEAQFSERFNDYALSVGTAPAKAKAVSQASESAADDQNVVPAPVPLKPDEPEVGERDVDPETPAPAPVATTTANEDSDVSTGGGLPPAAPAEPKNVKPSERSSRPAEEGRSPVPGPHDALTEHVEAQQPETPNPKSPTAPADQARKNHEPIAPKPRTLKTAEDRQRDAELTKAMREEFSRVRKQRAEEKQKQKEQAERTRKDRERLRDIELQNRKREQEQKANAAALAKTQAPMPPPVVDVPLAPKPEAKPTEPLTAEQKAEYTANDELRKAREAADFAFTLYAAGLITRQQLARANWERDEAEKKASGFKDIGEKLRDDVRDALRHGRNQQPDPSPDDTPKRGRKR